MYGWIRDSWLLSHKAPYRWYDLALLPFFICVSGMRYLYEEYWCHRHNYSEYEIGCVLLVAIGSGVGMGSGWVAASLLAFFYARSVYRNETTWNLFMNELTRNR